MDLNTKAKYAEKYSNQILLWGEDLAKLRSDRDETIVNWHVDNELVESYTVSSILRAVDKRIGKIHGYKDKYFVAIDKDHLNTVRPAKAEKVTKRGRKKKIERIIEILEDSYRSEDWHDYIDPNEDLQWGPGLGFAAQSGKEFNKELKELIRFAKRELK